MEITTDFIQKAVSTKAPKNSILLQIMEDELERTNADLNRFLNNRHEIDKLIEVITAELSARPHLPEVEAISAGAT